MSGDARDFNYMETRVVIKIFFLQGKAPKEMPAILTEILGEHAPSYATVKNWVAQFKRGDFSTCDAPRPGRPKTVTTPEIIDQIHELILEDRRISAKSIAEQLGISHEPVGSIIHEDLDMRKLSAKWVPKCQNAEQKHNAASRLNKFGIFSARSKWFPVAIGDHGRNVVIPLWPGNKATNQWSGGITAYRVPKNSECKKSAGKLALIFWDEDGILLIDYLPKDQLSTPSITHLCWCNWRTFWRKNAAGSLPRGPCSCTMPRLTGHLQPRRKWSTWACTVLTIHPILRIWPRRTTTCSLDWKNNWKVAIFRQKRRSFLPRRPGWTDLLTFFFEWLAKVRERAEKCTELRGEYVE